MNKTFFAVAKLLPLYKFLHLSFINLSSKHFQYWKGHECFIFKLWIILLIWQSYYVSQENQSSAFLFKAFFGFNYEQLYKLLPYLIGLIHIRFYSSFISRRLLVILSLERGKGKFVVITNHVSIELQPMD